MFWVHSNQSLVEVLENTKLDGEGPIDSNKPYLGVDDAIKIIKAIVQVQDKSKGRNQFFYKLSTRKLVKKTFPDLWAKLYKPSTKDWWFH